MNPAPGSQRKMSRSWTAGSLHLRASHQSVEGLVSQLSLLYWHLYWDLLADLLHFFVGYSSRPWIRKQQIFWTQPMECNTRELICDCWPVQIWTKDCWAVIVKRECTRIYKSLAIWKCNYKELRICIYPLLARCRCIPKNTN